MKFFKIENKEPRAELWHVFNSELHESGIFPGSYREGSCADSLSLQTLVVDLELVLLND